jgi:hypothetical protein
MERQWFSECSKAVDNWKDMNKDAYLIHTLISNFENEMTIQFPLAHNNPKNTKSLDAETLGKAIGYINRNIDGIYPFINYMVFTDVFNPDVGNRIYLDAPTLSYDVEDYSPDNWPQKKKEFVETITAILKIYFSATGVKDVTEQTIRTEAGKMADLEWSLAQNLKPDPDDFDTAYNLFTIANATTYFKGPISLKSMFAALAKDITGLDVIFSNPDYQIIIQSPDNYQQLLIALQNKGKYKQISILINCDFRKLWN